MEKNLTIQDIMHIIDEWLNSEDVFITDKNGVILPEALVDCKTGSLLHRLCNYKQNKKMLTYTESFAKIEVYYNNKNIGHIKREPGYHNYFIYYNNGHIPDLLDNEINESKQILENIVKFWENVILQNEK